MWELIIPNDNGRNMVKCEGLNLFRFQMSLVLWLMGLNGSTRDTGRSLCDVKVIGAWRLENVTFLKFSHIPKIFPFFSFTYYHLPLNITLKRCFWTKCSMNSLGWGWAWGVEIKCYISWGPIHHCQNSPEFSYSPELAWLGHVCNWI